jgi:hypothetical protein
MTSHADGFSASAESIDGSSHLLLELAGLLYRGRPDGELSVTARVPRSHQEVSDEIYSFARFTNDQFLDTVSLLAALSTKLKTNSVAYAETEAGVQGSLNDILADSRFVRPEDR